MIFPKYSIVLTNLYRPGKKGVTIADVAISIALLSVVMAMAMQVVLSLSSSAEKSLLRSNARQQVLLSRTSLANDIGAAMPCTKSRFGPVFTRIESTPDANNYFSLFSDIDADGDPDLVAYRTNSNRLQRQAVLNLQQDFGQAGCEALVISENAWETLATPVQPLVPNTPSFVASTAGVDSDYSGSCIDSPLACRYDTIQVHLELTPPGVGRVNLDIAQVLPDSISRLQFPPSVTDPPAATLPSPPTGVTGVPSNETVALTWISPAITNIVDYNVQYSSNAGSTWKTFSDGVSPNVSTLVTGLTNGTAYVFRVATVISLSLNITSTGRYSVISSSYTPTSTPSKPTNLTGTPSSQQVSLTWTAPASDGGSALTDYNIQSSSNNGSTWSTFADGTSTNPSTIVTSLINGTSYVFRVQAVNALGSGSFSDISISYIPTTNPNAPTGLSGVPDNEAVALTWVAPGATSGIITDYKVQYSSNAGSTWSTFADGTSTSPSTIVTSLTNGTSYVFRVAALVGDLVGPFSTASVSYTPFTVPNAPTGLSGVPHNEAVHLTWTAPSSKGSALTDYNVQYSSDTGSTWSTFADGTSTTDSATVTELLSGTGYIFRVRGVNAAGPGAYSAQSDLYTPKSPATAPTNLLGTAGNTTVNLTWTAPPTVNGGSVLTDYNVQYSSDAGATWSTFADSTSINPSTTVTGLTNGTSYVFRVRAVTTGGTGPYTAASSAYIPFTIPGTPNQPTVGTGTANRLDVSWASPSNGGSTITSYAARAVNGANTFTCTVGGDIGLAPPTACNITGLAAGTTYAVSVSATNLAGTSSWSTATNSATDGVSNYTYLGVDQTFTVPAGVTSLKVKLSGASGGTGQNWGGPNSIGCNVYGCFDNLGANGGVGTATIAVTPGAVYTVCPGGYTGGSSGGWNRGGAGGTPHAGYGGAGGGGGGKTDIILGATSCVYRGFLVAPGGGGGGGNFGAINYFGTAGGRGGNGGYNGDTGSVGLICWIGGAGGGGGGATQAGAGVAGVNDGNDACGFYASNQITNHTGVAGDAAWGAGGHGTGVYDGGKGGGGGGAGYNGGGGGSTRMLLPYGQYGAGGGGGGSSAGLTMTGYNAGNGSALLCWGASSTSCN